MGVIVAPRFVERLAINWAVTRSAEPAAASRRLFRLPGSCDDCFGRRAAEIASQDP
jgi:hypothetical protein